MKEHESLWSRFAKKMYDWGSALTMSMAAISGLTITGRRAVQSYADMEGEMANVRKFTGMTTEEVERLNESFKTMDTRSSREQLNKLAQEAGKLGIASQQAVIEYVEAADVINIALDELGEGATGISENFRRFTAMPREWAWEKPCWPWALPSTKSPKTPPLRLLIW